MYRHKMIVNIYKYSVNIVLQCAQIKQKLLYETLNKNNENY